MSFFSSDDAPKERILGGGVESTTELGKAPELVGPQAKGGVPSFPMGGGVGIGSPELEKLFENCFFRAATSGVAGGVLGFVFGAFFGSIGGLGFGASISEIESKQPILTQVANGFKSAGRSGWNMAKNFAIVGSVFGCTECFIEQYRGKSDHWNSVSAGCISGSALALAAGPRAMLFGCAGFAGFSYAIDWFTGRYDESTRVKHDDKWNRNVYIDTPTPDVAEE